jgi:mannose-6-phosphate isomerase-like protein (cupin superfamily)
MTVVDTQNAEHYIWGDGCDGWHLLKGDDLSVIRERVPAGKQEVMHYHNRARQLFFVLSGIITMLVGDERLVLTAGQSIEIPPGAAHQLKNESDSEIEFLVISAPKSHGDRVVMQPS